MEVTIMPVDDEGARKARAKNLRAQIDQLKKGRAVPRKPAAPESGPKSYRDMIHEKMNELDKDQK
jgi:hypothetical protein